MGEFTLDQLQAVGKNDAITAPARAILLALAVSDDVGRVIKTYRYTHPELNEFIIELIDNGYIALGRSYDYYITLAPEQILDNGVDTE